MNDIVADRLTPAFRIRAATADDIRAAFSAGMADFRAAPVFGMAFGSVYALGGLVILWLALSQGMVWVAFPMAAGFALLGPFVASGLYEVSRRREAGQPLTLSAVMSGAFAQAGREMSWMALITVFAFIIWMYQVRLLFALFFGFAPLHMPEFLASLLTTDGLTFLAVGSVVGAVLAFVLFSITVVSFPMLVDRDVDFITAMVTSVRAVAASPVVMLGWGVVTAVATFAAMVPLFLGLVLLLPLWGHATWHLYRRVVQPA